MTSSRRRFLQSLGAGALVAGTPRWAFTRTFDPTHEQACCCLMQAHAEDGDTACWNPLTYISSDPNLRISDVQRIAATLYPDVPGTDPFWSAGARSYFLGVTMYVLETPSLPQTLGEVLRQPWPLQ